jgi:hypothetical protein
VVLAFWRSGGIAVRAGLKVGQVFGQANFGGLRSAGRLATDDTSENVAGNDETLPRL